MNAFIHKHLSLLLITGFSLAILLGLGMGYVFFKPAHHATQEPHSDHIHEVGASETIWTCSMHPQIRQNEPGDCPICGMDLIPLEDKPSSDPLVLEMTPEAVRLAQVETTVLGAGGKAERTLTLSGKIQADERLSASQVAHIPGRIEQLFVSFKGEYVRKGQQIARVYSPELITAQQELLEAIKLRERNPGLYQATRQKLRYWKLTDDQIHQIEEDETIKETFDIYADATGIVSMRRVSVGDYVKQGEVLFDLVNLSQVWVLFDAYEEDLAQLHVGDPVQFTTPSVPGKTFTTRITFIDPVINPQTRVASVRGEVPNLGGLLKPEMFVRGTLASPVQGEEQLLVPKSAVLWTGQRSVVYLKVPDMSIPSFRYQEIELGDRVGSSYLVQNGLQPGDEVVTYGSFAIDAAAQLNNQQSMMNRLLDTKLGSDSDLPNYTNLTPSAFQQQLLEAVKAYLPLKDALVASDIQQAQAAAQILLEKLDQIDMKLLKGDIHDYWMAKVKALKSHTTAIGTNKDLTQQREQFSFLSTALIESIQVLGIKGTTLYVQHCPMAMENEGADWLSLQEEIRNPYFGDQMLTCGSITQQLPTPRQEPSSNPPQSHNH
ncbi:MAG: efflux RND transporter periplasmic adaptor subunit [Bacteroidetes bacterium]|nr:MAG: efflux RND transporter periplasmic adaptor subunit [Bacteroidota bacterium]